MVPVSWLLARSNDCNLERLPNCVGMLPSRSLLKRFKCCNLERLPS